MITHVSVPPAVSGRRRQQWPAPIILCTGSCVSYWRRSRWSPTRSERTRRAGRWRVTGSSRPWCWTGCVWWPTPPSPSWPQSPCSAPPLTCLYRSWSATHSSLQQCKNSYTLQAYAYVVFNYICIYLYSTVRSLSYIFCWAREMSLAMFLVANKVPIGWINWLKRHKLSKKQHKQYLETWNCVEK